MTKIGCKRRIRKAIDFAVRYGGIGGDHHKAWVIDQMIRALTGCPELTGQGKDHAGNEYTYQYQGESEDYKQLVKEAKNGEEGPDSYDWDVGIPP